MTTLTDRLDAVCIKLGITNQKGIEKAIEMFVRSFELCEKLEQGCGEEHKCDMCEEKFNCWNFCGQTMYRECFVCHCKRSEK